MEKYNTLQTLQIVPEVFTVLSATVKNFITEALKSLFLPQVKTCDLK